MNLSNSIRINKKGGQMKYRKLQFSVLLLFLGIAGISAQTVVTAAGGNASGSGGSATFTVGQVVYRTYVGTSGSVAEGVQQPYEISVVTGIEDIIGVDLVFSVYPNPTTDFLVLKIEEHNIVNNMSYQLFDANGRLLKIQKITDNETIINMVQFSAGTYFLKIVDKKQDIKTFKILKN